MWRPKFRVEKTQTSVSLLLQKKNIKVEYHFVQGESKACVAQRIVYNGDCDVKSFVNRIFPGESPVRVPLNWWPLTAEVIVVTDGSTSTQRLTPRQLFTVRIGTCTVGDEDSTPVFLVAADRWWWPWSRRRRRRSQFSVETHFLCGCDLNSSNFIAFNVTFFYIFQTKKLYCVYPPSIKDLVSWCISVCRKAFQQKHCHYFPSSKQTGALAGVTDESNCCLQLLKHVLCMCVWLEWMLRVKWIRGQLLLGRDPVRLLHVLKRTNVPQNSDLSESNLARWDKDAMMKIGLSHEEGGSSWQNTAVFSASWAFFFLAPYAVLNISWRLRYYQI